MRSDKKDRGERIHRVIRSRCTPLEHQRGDGNRAGCHQQGVTVRCRLGNIGIANRATGARPVFNNERLPQARSQFFGHEPAQGIGITARRVRHHNRDCLVGIGLGLGDASSSRQERDTRNQRGLNDTTQKITAKVFQNLLL